jgi:predicted RNA polymerase sigma factor
MLNFLYADGRKKWRSRGMFLAEKCATDAACAGVGRWPGRLSPNSSSATLARASVDQFARAASVRRSDGR